MTKEEIKDLIQGFQDVVDKLGSLETKLEKIDSIENKIDTLRSDINEYADKHLDAKKDYMESFRQLSDVEITITKHESSLTQLRSSYDTIKTTMDSNCPYCKGPYDMSPSGYHY